MPYVTMNQLIAFCGGCFVAGAGLELMKIFWEPRPGINFYKVRKRKYIEAEKEKARQIMEVKYRHVVYGEDYAPMQRYIYGPQLGEQADH